jgi:hypothetical protein
MSNARRTDLPHDKAMRPRLSLPVAVIIVMLGTFALAMAFS